MFDYTADHRAAAAQEEHSRRGPLPAGQVGAAGDYTLSRPQHALDLAPGLRVLGGHVVDAVGMVHNYKVALEHGCGVVRGVLGSPGSMGLSGARSTATIPAGTRVLVAWAPGSVECFILCALPAYALSATDSLADVVVPASCVGMKADDYLRGAFLLGGTSGGVDATGLVDASSHRPSDMLTGGEWGQVTETGTAFHLDPYLAFLRVNEETGVFAFYHDDLLRVTGHNLQLGSAGCWREDTDDAGFLSSEELVAARDYEALGVLPGAASTPFRSHTPGEVQGSTPWYYYLEPTHDDQQGFYRLRRYRGALGSGEKLLVAGPPPGRFGPFRHVVPEKLPGLYDHQVFHTGRQLTRSAKGIFLVKRPPMPVPWRKRPAMTGQGAVDLGSPFAELPGANGGPVTSARRVSAFLDQICYSGNFEGVHPFLGAAGSWYLPEESDLDFNAAAAAPDYYLLGSQQLLPTPDPVELAVGAGYGTASYTPNQAAFGLLDDGSIVLTDGWGSELRMSQGSITLQCAGDVWTLPGRNANTWAGRDVVMRARNSADLTAANGDVRVKGQNNVMVMGGNAVCGGVMIESRTPSPVYDFDGKVGEDVVLTGIVLKSDNGQIVQMARDIVLGADLLAYSHQPREGVDGAAADGTVVLDTGGGRVLTYARSCERRLGSGATDGYALDEVTGPSGSSFVWTGPAGHTVGGELSVSGAAVVRDCLSIGGWVMVGSGHVASTAAKAWSGKVATLRPSAATAVADSLSHLSTRRVNIETYLGDNPGPGRDDYKDCATGDVAAAEFSFRTDTQYRTDSGLVLPEGRWQQAARQAGQAMPVWREPIVDTVGGGPTLPHPGLEAWSADASGQSVDLLLHDDAAGRAVDRAAPDGTPLQAYDAAAVADAASYVLEAGFAVSGE